MHIFQKYESHARFIFISIGLMFSVLSMYAGYSHTRRELPYFFAKDMSAKYKLADGNLYAFISFCKDKIPHRSDTLFYSPWNINDGRTFMAFSYEREKARYYLYPIKVYLFPVEIRHGGLIGEYQEIDEILKKVSFIIVYRSDRIFPGFKVKYRYDDNKYILEKES